MPTLDVPLPDALTSALAEPRCIDLSLPKPSIPELRLPTGGTIKGVADLTKGIPSDCSMNASLAVQIAPIMASMECLLNVLKFLAPLVDVFMSAATAPPTLPAKLLDAVPKLAEAGEKLMGCIGMVVSPAIPFGQFVKDLLLLIVKMLKCMIQALKSAVQALDGIELEMQSAAQNGNDALAAQLECAKENAMLAAQGAMQSIDPIATLLALAGPFISMMPGAPSIELPSLASADSIDALKDTLDTLNQVVLTLEGLAEAIPL